MTDDEAKALGLRAVAWMGWRWLPGMLDGCCVERIFERCDLDGLWVETRYEQPEVFTLHPGIWPDLRDAATMGAAIALWQARPGHDYRCPCPVMTYAAVYGLTDRRTIVALVAALEASASVCAS